MYGIKLAIRGVLVCWVILIFGCKSLVPNVNAKFKVGYCIQYTKLDFTKIALSQDTSWHKQIQPLAELLIQHPNWTVKLKTFLADSSTANSEERLDMLVASNVYKFIVSNGVSHLNIIPIAFNNCNDKSRIRDQRFMKEPQQNKKFKKNTFEWEIISMK